MQPQGENPMRGPLAMLVFGLLTLAACAREAPPPAAVAARSCDDGGDGGVVIHGVCL
jgi:hypothetical protein